LSAIKTSERSEGKAIEAAKAARRLSAIKYSQKFLACVFQIG